MLHVTQGDKICRSDTSRAYFGDNPIRAAQEFAASRALLEPRAEPIEGRV